jgi:mono/diheme cytochrome c family protein
MQAKFIGVLICLAGVLAVAAVPTATSRAQHCGTPVVSSPYTVVSKPIVHHHNQVVVKEIVKEVPIAVPVLVPAFQFQYSPPCQVCPPGVVGQQPGYVPGYGQPGYGQPAATPPGVGATPPGVGTAQPVPVATPGQPAAPSSNDRIRELAKALLEEMQRQSGNGPDDGPPTVYDPNAPAAPPASTPPAPAPGSPPGVGSAPQGMTREQAAPAAIAALNRSCASCHTGVGSKGDFTIFQQPGMLNPNAGWRSILREIDSGRMPPKSSQFRLTPEETNAIRTWLSGL